jgi:hypothetical protein
MKTHCVVILDKSGSMADFPEKKKRTISDFNEKVQMYKQVNKEGEQEVLGYFVTFNNHLDEHVWGKSADELAEINEEVYTPNGGTALQDAIVHVLKKLKENLVLGEKDAVLVSIITDGEENASKEHGGYAGAHAVKQLIEELQATGKWTIGYIGANQDVGAIADRYGLLHANCAVYSDKNVGTVGAAYNHSNKRAENYFHARSRGLTASLNLMSDDGSVADLTNLKEEIIAQNPELIVVNSAKKD